MPRVDNRQRQINLRLEKDDTKQVRRLKKGKECGTASTEKQDDTSKLGRRDTLLYGYSFSAVLVINREPILAILISNRAWFLHLNWVCFFSRSYFSIIIDKTIQN